MLEISDENNQLLGGVNRRWIPVGQAITFSPDNVGDYNYTVKFRDGNE